MQPKLTELKMQFGIQNLNSENSVSAPLRLRGKINF
jgi:hypothetical protein